ncbi:MurR/RpiR family transcriptional regulator [Anaerococcus marasmi]|uniref:MurR/RpiR family transcriptional regulator n=1 Tax=Anaerococcus marasmi TaxID=2057797 RepID=UPI001319D722|nr:MurR/RpiR family transcriptional regulator [Anaerococcus marasmi]
MSLDILIKNYSNLTKSEKEIAHYISINQEDVINTTSSELAEKLYISKTTLINFCKKIGFEGFTEMKYYLKSNQEDKIEKHNRDNSTKDEILNEVKKTLEILDDEKVLEFCENIIASQNLYIASRGASKQIAISFCNNLNMLGIPAIFIDNFNLINVMKNHLNHKDTVIVISLSGKTKILNELSKITKINGSKLLTITAFHSNPIQNVSDNSLNFYSNTMDTSYRDIHSRIGMNIVCSYIISRLDEMMIGDNNDNKIK